MRSRGGLTCATLHRRSMFFPRSGFARRQGPGLFRSWFIEEAGDAVVALLFFASFFPDVAFFGAEGLFVAPCLDGFELEAALEFSFLAFEWFSVASSLVAHAAFGLELV